MKYHKCLIKTRTFLKDLDFVTPFFHICHNLQFSSYYRLKNNKNKVRDFAVEALDSHSQECTRIRDIGELVKI